MEYMLKTNFKNYPKGERFTTLLHDFLGRGIFNADGELWKMQRKTASFEFNTKSLRNFVVETVQWEIRNRLVPVLTNTAETGESIDLQDVFQRFGFDNICRVAFGMDPACLLIPSMPTTLPFAKAFHDATELSAGRFFYVVPFLWRIKRMLNIGSERRLRRALQVVHEFASQVVCCRREQISVEGSQTNDLLSRFIALLSDNSNRFHGDVHLEGHKEFSGAIDIFFEGNGGELYFSRRGYYFRCSHMVFLAALLSSDRGGCHSH